MILTKNPTTGHTHITSSSATVHGVEFVWNGSLTVEVRSLQHGTTVDVFSFAGPEAPTAREVNCRCRDWIRERRAALNA